MNMNYNFYKIMKNKNSFFVMVFLAFFVLSSLNTATAQVGRYKIPQSAYAYGYPSPLSLGVHMGTTGFGVHVYKPLATKFGLRLGASYMPFQTEIAGTYSNRDVVSNTKAKSGNVSLLAGWTPFVNSGGFFRSFGLQLGAAYFFQLEGNIETRLKNPYKYGDIQVSPELVGTINTKVNWKETINPYVGLGWQNIIIDSRFSMNVDLGCYYLSKPSVAMEATGLLEENTNNAAIIERNMENYRYLPRVEVGFSYRFWK